MQGGGQFHTTRISAGLDDIQLRAHEEMEAARRVAGARRHRPRHRQGHFGWLRLGRHHRDHEQHQHHAAADVPAATGPSMHRGPGHGESHGY